MRRKIFFLVVLCLLCVSDGKAQTKIILNEAETQVVWQKDSADFSLVLENSNKDFAGKILLELIDVDDAVRVSSAHNINIKSGKKIYQISLPLINSTQKSANNIAWFRLHYRVTNAENQTESEGIVSLSQILKDIFEIHTAASENLFSGMNYQVGVSARHPFTGAPVAGIKISAELSLEIDSEKENDKLNLKAEAQTDAQGTAILNFKVPPDAKLDDSGELKVSGEKYGYIRETKTDLQTLSARRAVYLNTDKPLYQPGQNLNVRGLFFEEGLSEKNIVKEAELEFLIKDEDDTLLYRQTTKTSRFGISQVAWQIPENAKLGEYEIEVKSGGEQIGRQIFKVSRYDLPQFTVKTETDKKYYLPKEKTAEVKISADYLFGKPVSQGTVKIVEESERRWNYREQRWDFEEGEKIEGKLDTNGKFTSKIDLSEDQKELESSDYKRYEDLHFAAYLTDATTNRTEARRFDIRISKEPIHVYLIGKPYDQNPKLPATFYLSTFYADGAPAACDVEISGKYENEKKEFPLARLKTNSLGAGKIEFVAPERVLEKRLELSVKVSDRQNLTGTNDDETIYFDDDDDLKISTDKTVYRPHETVKAEIISTKKDGTIYVDLVKDWTVIASQTIRLENYRAKIEFPFQMNFRGGLTIAAYAENIDRDGDFDTISDARGIIFPERNNLRLSADFAHTEYRPNDEAVINFNVLSANKKPLESALGIVVFDKAIEERVRTDADFGGNLNLFNQFDGLLGAGENFGGLTRRDFDELDLSKPVTKELQLAAEIMFHDQYYRMEIERSADENKQAYEIFARRFEQQLAPVRDLLKNVYLKNYEHPTDDASLRKILSASGIDFDEMRDPWGMKFRVVFRIEEKQKVVIFESAGADKKFETSDDLTVSGLKFEYFLPTGKTIDKTVSDYYARTRKFIRDEETLREELSKNAVDLNWLRDRWNHPYRVEFGVENRKYTIKFHSAGADGKFEFGNYDTDDFDVWENAMDYFAETEKQIQSILSDYTKNKKTFPVTVEDFKSILRENNFDTGKIRDGYGREIYITKNIYSRYFDKAKIENTGEYGANTSLKTIVEPVTQLVLTYKLRSRGADGIEGSEDDFELASFAGVISERGKDGVKKQILNIPFTEEKGAVSGTITDPNGAVVPGVKVLATNIKTDEEFSAVSNTEGFYLIEELPAGKYKIETESGGGFMKTVIENVPVKRQEITTANFSLQVGAMSATVDVSSGVEEISTSQSTVGYGEGNGDGDAPRPPAKSSPKDEIASGDGKSTPRLREYFPETLVWNPELITDKNGRAELKFKFADNLTTWKMYVIASDEKGKIGVLKKEVKTFQPFFADLEPPKFLTVGDEISLPVQIRNYTAQNQKVNVTMANGNWFSFLNSANQTIDVASNSSQNAVFGFRAETFVKDGKQRVTVIADKDSDAIEKPITVHPNGQEIIRTESKIFRDATVFDINFPAETLPKTARAELKIYPNLLAHVAESVTGLLERPYGCGEQTISSTYPNLLILKFSKTANTDEKLKTRAQNFLQKGYERLLGYQQANGGFSIWIKDEADIALTAYAIRFLTDAKEFIAVDEDVISRAQKWLLTKQRTDGSWTRKYSWENAEDEKRTKILTTYITRILAMTERVKKEKSKETQNAVRRAFAFLENKNSETDEPFAMASFALALFDAGEAEKAAPLIAKLQTMAKTEGGAAYWNLETNTPFYGWGTAGRIETTALVVQALTECKSQSAKCKAANQNSDALISKGTLFLLKNKDRYGVWYSTQTTINVLDALLAQFADDGQAPDARTAEIFADGKKIRDVQLPPSNVLANPLTVDLSDSVAPAANKIEVRIAGNNSSAMAQIVSNYYVGWQTAKADGQETNQSRQLRLDYKCDKTSAEIMQEINCTVEAERVGFKGYGMLLAEIGLPPGADVDRASLEKARNENWNFSRYDVLPDRIIVYLWAQAGGTKFNFKFKPRYAINAQTAASQVYDYYNPEAQATLAPIKFNIK